MKFYVHVSQTTDQVTFVFEVHSANTTINDIIQICEKELSARFQNEQFMNGSITRSERKSPLSEALHVMDGVKEKEDLLLIFTSKAGAVGHSEAKRPLSSVDSTAEWQDTKLKAKEILTEEELLKIGLELQASGHFQKSVLLYKNWLQKGNTSGDIWSQLVLIYYKADKFDKAIQIAEEGLKHHREHEALNIHYMKCLVIVDPKKALQVIMNYSKRLRSLGRADEELKHKLQMLLCKSYQKLNKTDMAIVLSEGVLREEKSHQEALIEYAKLTCELGEEQGIWSLNILLTALVKDKDNKVVREYLAEVCQKPKGMEYLQKVSGEAWNSIPALILLAGVFRDNGKLDLSLQVLKRAVTIAPDDPNAILNYIHLLEVLNDPDKAVKAVKVFCKSNCNSSIFVEMHQIIEGILKVLPECIYLYAGDHSSLAIPQVSAPSSVYGSDDLSTLAVWFTAVKIMFVQGALTLLPQLCNILGLFHESKELHLTSIRNEAAYFNCIRKVILTWPQLPSLRKDEKFIYLVGDSHCISPGWRSIQYKGQSLTVHPVLSTGTKIWHLCPQSVFYPKTNFFNVLSVIPDDALVVIILGEIDCREALVKYVERCIYDSLQEAVEYLINIYIELLVELQQKHHWKIFVHPVPPVLDITRSVVKTFNSYLKAAIVTLNSSNIHYLDGIVDDVLTEDEAQIKHQYAFDDTHLHPSYVKLLERSLEKY